MPNAITLQRPRRKRRRAQGGRVGGPLLWTPAMIADYMRQTQNSFGAVDRDYQAAKAAGRLPPAELANWVAFRDGWQAFYTSNRSSWSGGTVDRAEDYRNQLAGWRQRVARYVTPTSPAPHIDPSSGLWSFGGGAGFGVLLAVGVLVYMLSKTGGVSLPREA